MATPAARRPGNEALDKLADMMLHISTSLAEVRAEEFHELVREEHYTWFAKCLVANEARSDAGHDRFANFLTTVAAELYQVVRATYESYHELLSSCRHKTCSSREQSRLRNLGRWLEKLTVDR
jgi:CCR4-NOT transcription complex subunit 1